MTGGESYIIFNARKPKQMALTVVSLIPPEGFTGIKVKQISNQINNSGNTNYMAQSNHTYIVM